MARLRRGLGAGFWGELLDCFYCLSLWVAAPVTLLLRPGFRFGVIVWLALSGAACLLDRLGQSALTVDRSE
jgi:hypothetical protein